MSKTPNTKIGQFIAELTDDNGSKRIQSAKALVGIGSPVLKDLVKTLDTFDNDQRFFPAAIFVNIGIPAINVLAMALLTKTGPSRERIIRSLNQKDDIDTRGAKQSLRTILESEDDFLQEIAMEAMFEIFRADIRRLLCSPRPRLVL
jgi:hypothetical protein